MTGIRELHSAATIAGRVAEIASEIAQSYGGRELTMLGVLEDSFVFLADLLRALGVPVRTAFLRYDHQSLGGFQDISFSTGADLTGREVVLVEGVLETGVPQEYLIKHLESHGATNCRLCVLVDKPDARRVDLQPAWSAFEIREDYVFGYGLGFQERWRELPFLATFDR